MADLFGRSPQPFGGALAADSAVMTFAYSDNQQRNDAGLLIQQMSVNYSQPINRIYELSSVYVYYVAGRPRGEGQMATVVGPVGLATAFMNTYGDVCASSTNILYITFGIGCSKLYEYSPFFGGQNINADNRQTLAMSGVILTNVGFSVRAEDMMFNQAVNFMFASMEVS